MTNAFTAVAPHQSARKFSTRIKWSRAERAEWLKLFHRKRSSKYTLAFMLTPGA